MGKRRMRTCEICSAEYRPTYSDQRACGRACGAELQHRNGMPRGRKCGRCKANSESVTAHGMICDRCRATGLPSRTCDVCGKPFDASMVTKKRCGETCASIAASRYMAAYMLRRYRAEPAFRDRMITAAHARRGGSASPRLLLSYLIRRDHGRCGICRKPVRALRGPMRPSIDHIVPLSKGGGHDLANVQLAHYRCNLSKNNRGGGEQLLLIG